MRRLYIFIVSVLLIVQAYAQTPVGAGIGYCALYALYGGDQYCELCRKAQNGPSYYCACQDATPFYYGMDMQVTDTIWFSASYATIKNDGLIAYWFSDVPIRIEAYLTCLQTAPFKKTTIEPNKTWILDPATLDHMIDSLGVGGVLEETMLNMDIKFRCYTSKKGEGRVVLSAMDADPRVYCSKFRIEKRDTTLCQPLAQKADTTYLSADSCAVCQYVEHLVPDKEVYDTVYYTPSELGRVRYQGKKINDYGDYTIEKTDAKGCKTVYYLHAAEKEEQVPTGLQEQQRNAVVRYFDLFGNPVLKPTASGIYIRKTEHTTTKIIIQ